MSKIVFIRDEKVMLDRDLAELEQRLESHDEQIQAVFQAIRELMAPPQRSRQGRRDSIRPQQTGKTGSNRETQQYLENSRSGLRLLAGRVLIWAASQIMATLLLS